MDSNIATPHRTVQQDGLVLIRHHGSDRIRVYTTRETHLTSAQFEAAVKEVSKPIEPLADES